jgi:hypothetical protein
MIVRQELPYLVKIADNGVAYCGGIQKLFYKEDLIKIRDACNEALRVYDLFSIDDDRVLKENEKEIKQEYKRATNKEKQIKDTSTFIYIMIDHNTGYYKIGHSKNALRRESTLQSEKPTIELLYTFEGDVKDERDLHENYKDLRVRGEWFALQQWMIDAIIKMFDVKRMTKERRKEREVGL